MNKDLLTFDIPTNKSAIIKVIGVGGGGGNAVSHMYKEGIEGVDFIVCNTDAQVLKILDVPKRIQIGTLLTEGLGAGNKPEIGREAAIESIDIINKELADNTKMVFITAGMGGGTGTGAAPVIAEAAKEMGILTIGIVTMPFPYEGPLRIKQAKEGINELNKHVDSLLIINNAKVQDIYGDLGLSEALDKADDILNIAAKGIAEIITKQGQINVDFADVKTVMSGSGVALMGTGRGTGENRAQEAVENAIASPLLNNNDIKGAKNILLNIVAGTKVATMSETAYINQYIQEQAGNSAELIWGASTDEELGENLEVTVIVTGFVKEAVPEIFDIPEKEITKITISETANETDDTSGDTITKEEEKPIEDEYENKLATGIIIMHEEPQSPDLELQIEEPVNVGNNAVQEYGGYKRPTQQLSQNIQNYLSGNTRELEETPAFMRKKKKVEPFVRDKKTSYSRYTLKKDGDDVKLNENNSFLHDRVD